MGAGLGTGMGTDEGCVWDWGLDGGRVDEWVGRMRFSGNGLVGRGDCVKVGDVGVLYTEDGGRFVMWV